MGSVCVLMNIALVVVSLDFGRAIDGITNTVQLLHYIKLLQVDFTCFHNRKLFTKAEQSLQI